MINHNDDNQTESIIEEVNATSLNTQIMGKQQFLPISLSRLQALLLGKFEINDPVRVQWSRLIDAISRIERCQLLLNWDLMSELYAPFDPDRSYLADIQKPIDSNIDFQERLDICINQLELTLNRANFQKIDLDTIRHAVKSRNDLNLKYEPNFEVFDELRVYGRGVCLVHRPKRNWKKGFKIEMKPHAAWHRLLVMVKFRKDVELGPLIRSDRVYLRLFKDVAFRELEMHLPEQATRLKMPLTDRFSIASPMITGIPVIAYKLLMAASWMNPTLLATILALPVTKGWQSFAGFRNARLKHTHQMISNLFYLTLANNRQCLSRILEMAWVQEAMESILAYWVIHHAMIQQRSIDAQILDSDVEKFLQDELGITVDFQNQDALDKLSRLNLLKRNGTSLIVPDPSEALAILRQHWVSLSP